MITSTNQDVPQASIDGYFDALVKKLFRILLIKESGEPSLAVYIHSLRIELLGYKSLFETIGNDAMYISLISILTYLAEADCDVSVVKREVFKSISICKKLRNKFSNSEVI